MKLLSNMEECITSYLSRRKSWGECRFWTQCCKTFYVRHLWMFAI